MNVFNLKSKLYPWSMTLMLASIFLVGCGGEATDSASGANSSTGKGGSMARFSVIDDYLYTISGANLQLYDISDPADPVRSAKVFVDWDIETLFSYKQALFIGGQSGVYIFDNADRSNPQKVSEFTHASSCDPVVVSNDIAYITLRSGNQCFNGVNQMDVLDVTNIYSPEPVKTFAMQNPKGLGVMQQHLFVCDGLAGLKVFSLENPKQPQLLPESTQRDLDCYDLIPNDGELIVSDDSGLLQYRFELDGSRLSRLSEIKVE